MIQSEVHIGRFSRPNPHPPIPPDCPHFPVILENCTRYIIACVARCAWLDEARRIGHKYCENDCAYCDAEKHADAWGEWGRECA